MGGSWSCPDNYSELSQQVYKSSVHLCIQKKVLQLNNNTTNITYVSDITSGAESVAIRLSTTILCFLLVLYLVAKN